MKYLSLFSGIGGFELGIQQAYESISQKKKEFIREKDAEIIRSTQDKINNETNERLGNNGTESQQYNFNSLARQPTCIGFSEIDKYAIEIYQKHFPKHKNYGDITKIDANTLPDFDFLCGGFPCQSFSIAGKRRGFDDIRGTLFFDIARILKTKQPRLCLLENVKGLLSHDDGNTFKVIISTLDELGYDLQWQVLNSKNFGVPQNRERVFIVGHLRGTSRPEVFPFGTSDEKNVREGTYAHTINSSDWRGPNRNQKQTTIRTDEQNTSEEWDKSDSANNIRRTSYTNGARIRRLTPVECMRLQGFPDNWCDIGADGKLISDSQKYKCAGNAVTVNVIQAIMEKLCSN